MMKRQTVHLLQVGLLYQAQLTTLAGRDARHKSVTLRLAPRLLTQHNHGRNTQVDKQSSKIAHPAR